MKTHEEERRELGQELQTLRKKRRLTGNIASEMAGFSQSKLSKVENGSLLPTPLDVEELCAIYNASAGTKAELLTRLENLRAENSSWRIEPRHASEEALEQIGQSAAAISVFAPAAIPVLLQIPDYAKAFFASQGSTKTEIEAAVGRRVLQQSVLDDTNKHFKFVIGEAALFAPFCTREVAKAQLKHLIKVLQNHPNMDLGVLPVASPVAQTSPNAFVLYDTHFAASETVHAWVNVIDQQDLQLYKRMFNSLYDASLTGTKANTFIAECATTLSRLQGAVWPNPVPYMPIPDYPAL